MPVASSRCRPARGPDSRQAPDRPRVAQRHCRWRGAGDLPAGVGAASPTVRAARRTPAARVHAGCGCPPAGGRSRAGSRPRPGCRCGRSRRPPVGNHRIWPSRPVRIASRRTSAGRFTSPTVWCSSREPARTGSSATIRTWRRTGSVAMTWRPSIAAANAGAARKVTLREMLIAKARCTRRANPPSNRRKHDPQVRLGGPAEQRDLQVHHVIGRDHDQRTAGRHLR